MGHLCRLNIQTTRAVHLSLEAIRVIRAAVAIRRRQHCNHGRGRTPWHTAERYREETARAVRKAAARVDQLLPFLWLEPSQKRTWRGKGR